MVDEDPKANDGNNSPAPHGQTTQKWWTDEEERRVKRKLDLNVLPLMFILYMLSSLDRSNIGNAKAKMVPDLGLSDSQFQWLLTIFFIAYLLFQSGMILYAIIPPRVFVATCVFTWGLASTLQGTAQSWSGMMAARFFMGVAESCWGTGAAWYYTTLFPRREIGFRFAVFICGSAVASAFSGALAYGLLQAKSAIAPWRLLFIIEGIPTLLMAPVTYYLLPNSLSTARFLNDRERKIALARLLMQEGETVADLGPDDVDKAAQDESNLKAPLPEKRALEDLKARFDPRAGLEAFKEPLPYITAVLYFLLNTSYSSLPVYLPTILQGLGYNSIDAQGYSAPPYVCAFVVALGSAFAALAAAGYMVLGTSTSDHARYGACFMVAIGLFSFITLVLYWLLSNQTGKSKRGVALSILGTVGQGGTLLGTRLFPAKEGPRYQKGFFVCGSLLFFAVALIFVTLSVMFLSNRRRERLRPLGKNLTEEEMRERDRDVALNGSKSVYFRWTL
ncbi:hypothetical protein OC846_003644 [Tilletia horrida]|uniref:Major facilitator superfamily (MFS) profile domain-containing protein n=1 Tax=Tilletia horrida TaxID=155126 RepID=A0AAN6GRS7_9BASI|nr:hypothetical protein OC846_003644 [Tilletia horrida]KAK0564121.1 hypothetical protein OC861_004472 [Tilletia horrida]